jgi:hypothetical protein
LDRYTSFQDWIARQFPGKAFTLSPASADASFRRYFRVTFSDSTLIAMDAPPPQEDCRPFVHVAALMADAKVHVPAVLAQDLARGFLLLSDLGATTYLAALNSGNADQLFDDAIDTLIRWQLASREGVLPAYDEALLRRELELFPEWYLGRHLGIKLNSRQVESLEKIFRLILANNLAQPKVYIHRDYMPRNLMVSNPNPGVLDFQDAVFGPVSYDVASLFKDAFLSWEEERVLDWTVRYWEKAKRVGLPVNADFGVFYRDFEWMGLQRHLKVLGIFARICHRDGKPGYVEDTPRFLGYVRAVALRYAALGPLLRLLDEFQDREPAVGHTV